MNEESKNNNSGGEDDVPPPENIDSEPQEDYSNPRTLGERDCSTKEKKNEN